MSRNKPDNTYVIQDFLFDVIDSVRHQGRSYTFQRAAGEGFKPIRGTSPDRAAAYGVYRDLRALTDAKTARNAIGAMIGGLIGAQPHTVKPALTNAPVITIDRNDAIGVRLRPSAGPQ